jgi:hypothetical protein
MKKFVVFVSFYLALHTTICGQKVPDNFTPSGKPLALLYPNFHTDFSEGNARPAFDITRAYLGYEYRFSRDWYARVVLDVGIQNQVAMSLLLS